MQALRVGPPRPAGGAGAVPWVGGSATERPWGGVSG